MPTTPPATTLRITPAQNTPAEIIDLTTAKAENDPILDFRKPETTLLTDEERMLIAAYMSKL